MSLKDDFKTIKKLGSGMAGNVNLIEFSNGIQYALKIEKVADLTLIALATKSTNTREWREIEFSLNFANIFPDQFITLYDYDIIDNCEFIYEQNYYDHLPKLPVYVQTIMKEKEKGTHCIRKLYNKVDTSLKNAISLSTRQRYSVITQLLYIVYLLHTHEYTHNDLHSQNIGVLYVDETKTCNILDNVLHLYGIHILALDFGIVLNNKYDMTAEETLQHKFNSKHEINRFIIKLIKFEPNDQINKLITWDVNVPFFQQFVASEKKLLVYDNASNNFDRFIVYQVLYPDEFQRAFFGEKYVKTYTFECEIDLVDFLYIFKQKINQIALIKYFIEKTNSK